MCEEIYDVDPEGEVTPIMVRDAIVKCFIQAHHEAMGKEAHGNMADSELMMLEIVIKAFEDTDGVFEEPTKESILAAIIHLKEFTEHFRDPKLVQKHFEQIKILLDKL